MNDANSHRYTIVVGVDFEPDGDRAFDAAVELAAARGGAEIHVVYVDTDLAPRVTPLDAGITGYEAQLDKRTTTALDSLEQLCTARIDAMVERGINLQSEGITAHFRVGRPAEQLVQLAADLDADLIAVGTHGRKGVQRMLLGSVAATVLRIARCPVYVVRAKDHEELGEIPAIEPACPDCVIARKETAGAEYWCERHRKARRPLAHRYHHSGAPMRISQAPWGPSMD
jgi:nucleotide-binding universal stress UspA family protein